MDVHPNVNPSEPLPSGFACPLCRYDLSESRLWKCPECGHECSTDERGDYLARSDDIQRIPKLIRLQIIVGIVLVGLLGGIAAAVTRQVGTILTATGVSGAILVVSWVGGWCVARCARAQDRQAWFVMWLRIHLWLHVCWVCLPICAASIFLYAAWAKSHIVDGDVAAGIHWGDKVGMFGAFGFLIWFAVVIGTSIFWLYRWRILIVEYRLHEHRARVGFITLAVIVITAAGIFAIWYGSFVGASAHGWVDPT